MSKNSSDILPNRVYQNGRYASQGYHFSTADNDITEVPNYYQEITDPKHYVNASLQVSEQSTNSRQENSKGDHRSPNSKNIDGRRKKMAGNSTAAKIPEPTKQPRKARKTSFEVRGSHIMIAFAIVMNFVLLALGTWLAAQGENRIAQIRGEVIEINNKMDVEVEKRINADDKLGSGIETHAMQINNQLEDYRVYQHFVVLRQRNITESMNLTLANFQQKLDLLSGDQETSAKTLNSKFEEFQEKLDILTKRMENAERKFIRLVGGSESAGRVEIFHDGLWGTICDDVVDRNAGNVMCRLLGFKAVRALYDKAAYGQGSGKIWLDNLRCIGNEISLGDCTHNGWGVHNCRHSEDLSIICT